MKRICLIVIVLALLPFQSLASETETMQRGTFTNDAGTRPYELFTPDLHHKKRLPLVVMLHGCTQNAQDFAAGTEMNKLANLQGFFVLYPEQTTEANANRCWNWFEVKHQSRSKGEPSIIAEMTKQIINNHRIDPQKVYIAGMSAGGAMTVIMGATYPELYKAIGVSAGLEFEAATDLLSGVTAMQLGGPDPKSQGIRAFDEMGEHKRIMPVIVFHGEMDATVNIKNSHQVASQWITTNDYVDDGQYNHSISDQHYLLEHGKVSNGYNYTKSIYFDSNDKPIIEKWIISEMTHKWSGGSSNGSYTDAKGPNASFEMVRFFNNQPKREY